jgi:hypothetical protein
MMRERAPDSATRTRNAKHRHGLSPGPDWVKAMAGARATGSLGARNPIAPFAAPRSSAVRRELPGGREFSLAKTLGPQEGLAFRLAKRPQRH